MRLINTDKMVVDETNAYMSTQKQNTDDLQWLINFAAHNKIQRFIADAPTVDAEVVVRCKDCKYAYYYNEEGCHGFVCNGYFQYADVEPNDFCSYGEMRNNDCPNCGADMLNGE